LIRHGKNITKYVFWLKGKYKEMSFKNIKIKISNIKFSTENTIKYLQKVLDKLNELEDSVEITENVHKQQFKYKGKTVYGIQWDMGSQPIYRDEKGNEIK